MEISLENNCKVEQMKFFATGYPFRSETDISDTDPRVGRLAKIALRTLLACSHETYMDCPYYEQLMYTGDTRIEALCSYVISADRRLPQKALRALSRSQYQNGMLASRWPSKDRQEIPSFALIYILMLHDFSEWNDGAQFIAELLPTALRIIEYFCKHISSEYLLENVPGWNFIDWAEGWRNGIPPGQENDMGCSLNWFFVLALQSIAELEKLFGKREYSNKYAELAEKITDAIRRVYYNPTPGVFAEDREGLYYSEHAQVLALLASGSTEIISELSSGNLDQCSLYFSFYYQEACLRHGLNELFERRLEKHYALLDAGLKTIPEEFENPRSDCHAWGAYPLYHLYRNAEKQTRNIR